MISKSHLPSSSWLLLMDISAPQCAGATLSATNSAVNPRNASDDDCFLPLGERRDASLRTRTLADFEGFDDEKKVLAFAGMLMVIAVAREERGRREGEKQREKARILFTFF